MLRINNLSFAYDKDLIIEGFNLEVLEGEIVALKGKSGSGKSTILRLIANLEKAKTGEILIDGSKHVNINYKDRMIGYLFQDYALFPHMTVQKNIEFGISHLSKGDQKALIKEYSKLLEIENLLSRYPHEISGGQKQRVALARTLVTKPKILLLDEPMSALDTDLKDVLRLFLRKVLKELNITTIVVTHDKEDVEVICDRAILID